MRGSAKRLYGAADDEPLRGRDWCPGAKLLRRLQPPLTPPAALWHPDSHPRTRDFRSPRGCMGGRETGGAAGERLGGGQGITPARHKAVELLEKVCELPPPQLLPLGFRHGPLLQLRDRARHC